LLNRCSFQWVTDPVFKSKPAQIAGFFVANENMLFSLTLDEVLLYDFSLPGQTYWFEQVAER